MGARSADAYRGNKIHMNYVYVDGLDAEYHVGCNVCS